MPAGRGRQWIPGELRIQMGVHIDKTGRDYFALCIDFSVSGGLQVFFYSDNPVSGYRNVGATPLGAGSIVDRAIANDDISSVLSHSNSPLAVVDIIDTTFYLGK